MYPPISIDKAQELAFNAVDWALSHGLIVRAPSPSDNEPGSGNGHEQPMLVTHAPFTLFPTPFPASVYETAMTLQPIFNQLVDACARDHDFISECMRSLSKVDHFVEKLFAIYDTVHSRCISQKITLGLHRSDYMLHNSAPPGHPESLSIKQVELNTIAASFSSLSNHMSDLHQYLAQTELEYRLLPLSRIPVNTSLKTIPRGLAKAWQLYNQPKAIVLMVIQPGERNAFDQRWIEYTLHDEYKIQLVRKSLAEIHEQGMIYEAGELIVNEREVAVTYFRAGYAPTDYPTDAEWHARLLIEESKAIKCPNIAYHLAMLLRSCFMRMYPLDESDVGIKAIQDALGNPENYVMKPQREGGGNNIYGSDIKHALQKLPPAEQNAYILMELIRAPYRTNIMVRQGNLITGDVVSELGVYGIWISEGDVVHVNESGGHLLRTKASTSNEGGIAAGFAVLDSPLLV
ncbi:glutathione synthase [Synchytrium endobioticum]|uniref:Glutathione synthetase n=1 Tax=Synchytrium endobioticum TaxID=286115 RepID=A0A507DEN4_9FUNG|nr:glutathione synthase [Synchytrium endobioticum]